MLYPRCPFAIRGTHKSRHPLISIHSLPQYIPQRPVPAVATRTCRLQAPSMLRSSRSRLHRRPRFLKMILFC